METESNIREGHISRCLRAILVNKGLIKLTSSISESYLNKLNYNILRAYIFHIVMRGNNKKIISTLKESQVVDWQSLLINKPNLYKALISSGLIALSISVPISAPIATALQVTSAVTAISTTFKAIGSYFKKSLGFNQVIEKGDNIDKNDFVFGK
jgi:hypothetical protein